MSHAILSPSSASRWLSCPPSARLEAQYPDTESEAAREGSFAHHYAETRLRYHYGIITGDQFKAELAPIMADPFYNVDMQGYVAGYVHFVIAKMSEMQQVTKDAEIFIERKLDLTEYVPEGFGTGDIVIIGNKKLIIIDLKYGKGVRVNAFENKQMMLYALGALRDFDFIYDIETVETIIYQPRLDNISDYEISVADLKEWAEKDLTLKALQAFNGEGELKAGDHCGFCRAKATCPALYAETMEVAKHEFKDAAELSDDQILEVLAKSSTIKSWLNALENYVFKKALEGKKWEGYKLVRGRANRVYRDENEAAELLLLEGISSSKIYDNSLKGITALEKELGKKEFDRILSSVIIKPLGAPTLVPETDARNPFIPKATAAEDFGSEENVDLETLL